MQHPAEYSKRWKARTCAPHPCGRRPLPAARVRRGHCHRQTGDRGV